MADPRALPGALTARAAGLVGCRTCGKAAPPARRCLRCGSALRSRTPASLQRVLAWLALGLICYVPANLLPMLVTRTLLRRDEATILGGAADLVRHGAYGVAAVVVIASLLIPVAKFLVIGYLAWSVRSRAALPVRIRVRLYEIVEFIGRWSMIDVFVVAILAALVQLGFLVSVNPGPAAVFFALSVAFTMLAAQSLDPRLLWDAAEGDGAARG